MRAYSQLPENYREIFSIDLQKNKKISLLVNGLAILIAAVVTVPVALVRPIEVLFDMSAGMGPYMLRFLTLMVGCVVYMVLHELVHGAVMKLCGTKKVRYGFTGLYAFAGSEDYYDKKSYITIALAPIVVLGIVLAVVNICVPDTWFWVVYFIQITNLSGAAGDLYVTVKFSKMPRDILVSDYGVGMKVYSAQSGETV